MSSLIGKVVSMDITIKKNGIQYRIGDMGIVEGVSSDSDEDTLLQIRMFDGRPAFDALSIGFCRVIENPPTVKDLVVAYFNQIDPEDKDSSSRIVLMNTIVDHAVAVSHSTNETTGEFYIHFASDSQVMKFAGDAKSSIPKRHQHLPALFGKNGGLYYIADGVSYSTMLKFMEYRQVVELQLIERLFPDRPRMGLHVISDKGRAHV